MRPSSFDLLTQVERKVRWTSNLKWLALLSLPGCSTLSYLSQAWVGQLEILQKARPISEVLSDERVSLRTKSLLKESEQIRKYLVQAGLKPTKNYTEFVDLKRDAAVWVVSACAPLEFKSKVWKFPIVGEFPFLGYFDLKKGRALAESLKQEGYDVHLRPASAYSTLGWFRDPVLSTMIAEPSETAIEEMAQAQGFTSAIELKEFKDQVRDLTRAEWVDVLIHESVHATLYFSGLSEFNESLAMFIAQRLTEVYLDESSAEKTQESSAKIRADQKQILTEYSAYPERAPSRERLNYLKSFDRSSHYRKKMNEVFRKLDQLYRSEASEDEKRQKKQEWTLALQTELKLRVQPNNASLIQFRSYHSQETHQALDRVWKSSGGDLSRFLAKVSQLKVNAEDRQGDLTGAIVRALDVLTGSQ